MSMLSKSPFSCTFETLVLSWGGLKVGRGVVAELAELASNREGFALEDPHPAKSALPLGPLRFYICLESHAAAF